MSTQKTPGISKNLLPKASDTVKGPCNLNDLYLWHRRSIYILLRVQDTTSAVVLCVSVHSTYVFSFRASQYDDCCVFRVESTALDDLDGGDAWPLLNLLIPRRYCTAAEYAPHSIASVLFVSPASCQISDPFGFLPYCTPFTFSFLAGRRAAQR